MTLTSTAVTILTTLIITLSTRRVTCSASNPKSPIPSPSPATTFKAIYAFGDSYTDTGNTRSASGPSGFGHVSDPPYGVTFFHRPTNRYSDGRLVVDFAAASLSLPFLPPYRSLSRRGGGGANFAVAGSTATPHGFFEENNLTLNATPESIATQLGWLDEYLERLGCGERRDYRCEKAGFEDSLFWVGEIGVNDYAYTVGSTVTADTIRPLAMTSYSAFLTALLKKGAKYVVIQGFPPTGCLPLAMSLSPENDRDDIGCVATQNNQSLAHNTAILNEVKALRRRFPDSTIAYFDYFNAYREVMRNPSRYGFAEPFKACCGTGGGPYNFDVFSTCGTPEVRSACEAPSRYINWDGVHLTEAMYEVLADMFLKGGFSHPPFSHLLQRKLSHGRVM